MSREILFKAKRVDNGEWVEGNYAYRPKENGDDLERHYILVHDDYGFRWYEVGPKTICQYTGLTDKNGKKIWENDIVKFPDCDMSTESGYGDVFVNAGKVAYDTESMSYFFTNRVTVDMVDIIIKVEVEAIGNVFDNPELLEN